jgi:chromosome partitioning protein
MAKRISIINFKGGVGKTTLTFELAAALASFHGAKVLLIDMDHQSSLSIICLTAGGWEQAVQARHTVTEIFKPFVGQGASLPGVEIIERRAIRRLPYASHYHSLDIASSSLELDDVEIDLTASHQGDAITSEWNKRTLMCKWIEETGVNDDYDYIIFDCPPATKIVSQNAIAASHGYIVPVVPEAVMERGAPHLVNMMRNGIDTRLNRLSPMAGEPRSMHVPDTELVGIVITRIQTAGSHSGYTDDHTVHLRSLQRTWGTSLLTPYIESGTGISQALDQGVPVYERAGTQNIGKRGLHRMYTELSAVLKTRIDAL